MNTLPENDLDEFSVGCVDIRKEVLGVLKSIKVGKSPGPDGIYLTILREASEKIAGALTEIFVSDWKIVIAVPLFKKGSRDNPENLRPVSLTSVAGKLEKILRDRIYSHLETNGLSDGQHGLVKGRSCLTN